MGKNTTPAQASTPKKERKVLTPAERVAKLERELTEAREKAAAKADAGRIKAGEKRAKLVARIAGLQSQVDEIDAEYPTLAVADEAPAEDAGA